MARLSGEQVSELQEAILDAFEADELRQFLLARLDKDLSHISLGGNLRTVVFDVITQAERAGWTSDLLDAVASERPKRSDLVQLCGRLRSVVDSPEPPDVRGPDVALPLEELRWANISAAPAKSRTRWHPAVLLAGIGLLAALAVVWSARRPNSLPGEPTPPPLASAAGATASSPPGSTTVSPLFFPPLPDSAPPLTTTVRLLLSPVCADEQAALAANLADATGRVAPPVLLEKVEALELSPADRTTVRSDGARAGADLVIWCTAGATGPIIHLERITQRGTPEVYEPETISMPARPLDPMQRAALAVTTYLSRDYEAAVPILRTAADVSQEAEARDLLTLLSGNAQLLGRDYSTATDTLDRVVNSQPMWAFAWHNLGVAELYAAWESYAFDSALSALAEAQRIDPGFDLSLVSQARIHRQLLDEIPGSYANALTACELAAQSTNDAVRVQGESCAAITQLVAFNTGKSEKLPRVSDRASLADVALPYWAEPLAVYGFVERAYWQANQDRIARDRAQGYFLRYLAAAREDVNLEEARAFYQDAIYYVLHPDE
jgi:hypothetical protein